MKESPSLFRFEGCRLGLAPLVVQYSDSPWTPAPDLPKRPIRPEAQIGLAERRPLRTTWWAGLMKS